MAKTNVYKVELMIVDHDGVGTAGIISALENAHYPNRCISPHVRQLQMRAVDWSDEHPLNKKATMLAAYDELFSLKS
jgi:hypothetical protein